MKQEIFREPTVILNNSIKHTPKVKTLKPKFSMELAVVPPDADNKIKINVSPILEIINMTKNQSVVSKFKTSTVFTFNNAYDTPTTYEAIYRFIIDSLRDFNSFLFDECRSIGLATISFPPPSFEQTLPQIEKAWFINNSN